MKYIIISAISTALHILNSASIILFTPGEELLDYISGSVLFGLTFWFACWVVPSIYSYEIDNIDKIRSTQSHTLIIGIVIALLTNQNLVGILFSFLVLIEIYLFLPSILLIKNASRILIISDFARASLNTLGLLCCLIYFDRNPVLYIVTLNINLVLIGCILYATKKHIPYKLYFNLNHGIMIEAIRNAYVSDRFKLLITSKVIETIITMTLSTLGQMGAVLTLRISSTFTQIVAFNSRTLTTTLSILLGVTLYISIFLIILYANENILIAPIQSIQLITYSEIIIIFPPYILILILTIFSLKKSSKID